MNYDQAVSGVRKGALAVSGGYLALIVLDVTVMASALPSVYVTEPAASCGARFLVRFAAHYIYTSGFAVLGAAALAQLYSMWIEGRKLTYTLMGFWGKTWLQAVTLVYGALSLYFLATAAHQLFVLGNPPVLPADFAKTHACTMPASAF